MNPTRRLIITDPAMRDLVELGAYFEREGGEELSLRFKTSAVETAKTLQQWAEAHPLYDEPTLRELGLRKVAVSGFKNHLIFYRIEEQYVRLVRVLHGARDLPEALQEEG